MLNNNYDDDDNKINIQNSILSFIWSWKTGVQILVLQVLL